MEDLSSTLPEGGAKAVLFVAAIFHLAKDTVLFREFAEIKFYRFQTVVVDLFNGFPGQSFSCPRRMPRPR